MKVLGVLCLAAYAVCVLASGYLPGKEYVYKYKGKVFAELDEQHHQHSGLAIKSEVHVQPKPDSLLVKIDHVVFDKLNERVTKERGYSFNYKENEALSKNLQKPFQIFLDRGLVDHVLVSKDDPLWSVNMKISLAALFQLNFNQINATHGKQSTEHKEPDLEAHYFEVVEDSLYGECETMYQIGHDPSPLVHHTTRILNVTKSTNYEHCTRMPYYLYENVNFDHCVDCKSDQVRPERLSNVIHYNLRGDRQGYVIEKVHTESEFTHLPWTRNGDMAYIHTNRTLALVDERDVVEDIHLEEETDSHTDLHFHFYGEHGFKEIVDLKEPHFLYHFLGKSAEIDVIGKEYNDLLEPILDNSLPEKFKEHHAPYKFAEIVKHFSTLSYDEIEAFFKKYVDLPSENPAEIFGKIELFFDVLSSAGTNPAFLFAKNHLSDDRILPHVAVHFIQMLPFTIKEASETLFDEIKDLCENKLQKSHHLENICYLAFSSIIYEQCVGKNYEIDKRLPNALGSKCTPEVAKKYYDHVVHHFENDHEELELITGIKATGNFGLKDGVAYLKKYIDNDHYPIYFRVAAIWALRRIAHTHPEAVLEELVPVYFNLSEGHEVRLAAFGVLMLANPPRSVLEAIGVALHEEHNHQVVSFVSSAFYYFAHSHYPCHQSLKGDIEHVLRHVMRLDSLPHFDFKHSRYYLDSGYNEEFGYGGMSSISYVTSNDSYLPHTLYVGANDYLLDKSIESIAVVINQEGLDKFVDRIFGPEGLFKKKKSIFDLFHRRVARDTASVEKELKEIDEALHIKSRHERNIHGDISVRMFGHEVSFFYFNESLFEDFLRDGYFNVPDLQNELKKLPDFTVSRFFVQAYAVQMLPSCLGFPTFLSYQEPTALYYKNNEFAFEVSPSIFSEDRSNEAPKTLHVRAKGHLIHDTVRRGVMGLSVNFDHTTLGVGLLRRSYINKPIDLDLKVDLKDFKIDLKATRVENFNLLHVSAHPFTFIDDYANEVDIAVEGGYLPYYKLSEMKEVHESHYHDYLGYGLDVKAKYGKLDVFRSREYANKFFEEHSLRDAYYRLLVNPHMASYELDVDVTGADTDPTDEVEIHLDFDHHDLKSNKPLDSDVYDHHHDLEEHARELPGRKFHTYIVKAKVNRKGAKERIVQLEGTYTHSCDHKLQKYTLYYDRSPHHVDETEHFQICGSAYMRYPDYDIKKLHDLDTLDLDQKIHCLAKIGFGTDCKNDKKITVTGILSRTQEQVDLEHKREEIDHLHYNPYAHYYHQCKEEHERGAHYDYHCRKYISLATTMNHYDIDFEFETEMTKEFVNETRKLFSWLEHELHYYKDQDFIQDEERKKLEFHLSFSPVADTVDIEILRRHSTDHYNNVPLDHVYAPVSASPYLTYSNLKRINRVFAPSLCSIEGDYVTTFDNVTFHIPPIDCWKVLAKDCSEHEHFLILGKKTTNPNYPKAVKVFLGKVKVEILPVTDTSEPIVRVNGKKVDVSKASPHYYHPAGQEEDTSFQVIYNGVYYTIISEKYGVKAYYDGKAIVSQISPYYKGKQCGLCGDYNHEHDREFRGPEDCVYHSAEDFAAAYAIHEDGCLAPKINKDACEKPQDLH